MNFKTKIILALVFFFSGMVLTNAQKILDDVQLDSLIRVCIVKIDKLETVENMKWSANMMERVVNLNNGWSSNYYLCYFYLLVAMELENETQKMVYFNSFMKRYEIAEGFAKTNREKSELYTLLAFLKIDLLTTDPLKYGKNLSGEIFTLFDKALELYSENPRAIYLEAVFKTGMASFFKKEENYCDSFLRANKIFIKDFVNRENYLMPLWGAEHNSALLLSCYDSKD